MEVWERGHYETMEGPISFPRPLPYASLLFGCSWLYPLVTSDLVSKLSLSSVSCSSRLIKPKEGIVGTLDLIAGGSEAQATV